MGWDGMGRYRLLAAQAAQEVQTSSVQSATTHLLYIHIYIHSSIHLLRPLTIRSSGFIHTYTCIHTRVPWFLLSIYGYCTLELNSYLAPGVAAVAWYKASSSSFRPAATACFTAYIHTYITQITLRHAKLWQRSQSSVPPCEQLEACQDSTASS